MAQSQKNHATYLRDVDCIKEAAFAKSATSKFFSFAKSDVIASIVGLAL